MRRVKYFVTMSLDAYIAGPGGEVDWLFTDQDYGMKSFFAEIDTVLIGRKTYEFMLAHGARSYSGFTNIVFSRTLTWDDYPEVTVHADDPGRVVAALKVQKGRDIWLVGGGELFFSLLQVGCVDEVIVALHPVLLGRGIPMLPPTATFTRPVLRHVTPYETGLVTLHYTVGWPSLQHHTRKRPDLGRVC